MLQFINSAVDFLFHASHHATLWVSMFTAQKCIALATIDHTSHKSARVANFEVPHPDLIAPNYREPE